MPQRAIRHNIAYDFDSLGPRPSSSCKGLCRPIAYPMTGNYTTVIQRARARERERERVRHATIVVYVCRYIVRSDVYTQSDSTRRVFDVCSPLQQNVRFVHTRI